MSTTLNPTKCNHKHKHTPGDGGLHPELRRLCKDIKDRLRFRDVFPPYFQVLLNVIHLTIAFVVFDCAVSGSLLIWVALTASVVVAIAEVNSTHVWNPLWVAHARFHVLWSVLSRCMFSGYVLYHFYVHASFHLLSAYTFATITGHLLCRLLEPWYGGSGADPYGYRTVHCCGREVFGISYKWSILATIWCISNAIRVYGY